MPVPPYHSCAESNDNVLPVQEVSHFGGSRSSGGETPVSVQVFLIISVDPFYYSLIVGTHNLDKKIHHFLKERPDQITKDQKTTPRSEFESESFA